MLIFKVTVNGNVTSAIASSRMQESSFLRRIGAFLKVVHQVKGLGDGSPQWSPG